MKKEDIILGLLHEVRDEQKGQGQSISTIEKDTERNTESLVKHMKRTELAEARLVIIEDRLTLKGFLGMLFKLVVGAGTVAGAIFAVIRLLQST